MLPIQNKIYCNNCGKPGHMYHQCKMPILSLGTIVFKEISKINDTNTGYIKEIQYLMIRRNHTYGFMDFIRGKYSVYNKDFLINLFKEMTVEEKDLIDNSESFNDLWKYLWNHTPLHQQYKQEKYISEEKYNILKEKIIN
jgi:hypothetical protein